MLNNMQKDTLNCFISHTSQLTSHAIFLLEILPESHLKISQPSNFEIFSYVFKET
jgi:hypothetical protein